MMKKLLIITMVSVLFACSNAPEHVINYYLLNKRMPINTVNKFLTVQSSAHLVKFYIKEIRLPQYLKQSSLVMQVAENQLHFSHYDLWGESLTNAIEKSLKQDLNNLAEKNKVAFVAQVDKKLPSLSVEIDHFYPSAQANVILAGRYWFSANSNNAKASVSKVSIPIEFNFERSLTNNGYAAAVKGMRSMITELAQKISLDAVNLHAESQERLNNID